MNNIKKNKNAAKIFNKDINSCGSYVYTRKEIFSANLVHQRITDKIIEIISNHFPKEINILDIGCGDGTYTLEIYNKIKPNMILGFDPATKAIASAQLKVSKKLSKKIIFREGSVYEIDKFINKNKFQLIIIRAVLHHLDRPQVAINKISKLADKIIVLEPNGYSPILKIFERTSKYHLEHNEKSYFPSLIDKWFYYNSILLKKREIFNIIPCFSNRYLAKFLKFVEPIFENIPLFKNIYCSLNLSFYEIGKLKITKNSFS